jgi:hypothetical protein
MASVRLLGSQEGSYFRSKRILKKSNLSSAPEQGRHSEQANSRQDLAAVRDAREMQNFGSSVRGMRGERFAGFRLKPACIRPAKVPGQAGITGDGEPALKGVHIHQLFGPGEAPSRILGIFGVNLGAPEDRSPAAPLQPIPAHPCNGVQERNPFDWESHVYGIQSSLSPKAVCRWEVAQQAFEFRTAAIKNRKSDLFVSNKPIVRNVSSV